MQNKKKTIGTCPFCGGNVVKTARGYRCEASFGDSPACTLNIGNVVGNRRMEDAEIKELIETGAILLDGFTTKEGKTFTTVLRLAQDGSTIFDSTVTRCPNCGGDIRANAKGFSCANYNRPENPCQFVIWRNIGGHSVTLNEAIEICNKGITSAEAEMYTDEGVVYSKRLGLSPDKIKVIKV